MDASSTAPQQQVVAYEAATLTPWARFIPLSCPQQQVRQAVAHEASLPLTPHLPRPLRSNLPLSFLNSFLPFDHLLPLLSIYQTVLFNL